MIAAGRLTERVTLQSKSVTRAANGEEVVTWNDVATVWAQVRGLSAREFFAAAQLQAPVEQRITIRWRSDVTAAMRVVWNGQALAIAAPPLVIGRNEGLELLCTSVGAQ